MVNEIKKALRIIEELKEEYKDGRIQKLEDIFATKDAYEGLSSLIQGRRPNYNNE